MHSDHDSQGGGRVPGGAPPPATAGQETRSCPTGIALEGVIAVFSPPLSAQAANRRHWSSPPAALLSSPFRFFGSPLPKFPARAPPGGRRLPFRLPLRLPAAGCRSPRRGGREHLRNPRQICAICVTAVPTFFFRPSPPPLTRASRHIATRAHPSQPLLTPSTPKIAQSPDRASREKRAFRARFLAGPRFLPPSTVNLKPPGANPKSARHENDPISACLLTKQLLTLLPDSPSAPLQPPSQPLPPTDLEIPHKYKFRPA